MSRTLMKRLEKLEQRSQSDTGKWHVVLGHTNEAVAEKRAELEASEAWRDGDNIIAIRFVTPEEVQARQVAA